MGKDVWDEVTSKVELMSSNNSVVTIVTGITAGLFFVLTLCFALWHMRPSQPWSVGKGFYTMLALYAFMSLGAFGFVFFTGKHLHDLLATFRDQELVMHKTAWDIIYYDAILTTSASRFVMTAHNSGWIDEQYTGVPGGVRVYDYWFINYIETVARLDEAIKYAVEKATSEKERATFRTIDTVNKVLVDLEQVALCSCEPPDASALPANDTTIGVRSMYSPSYLEAKETYNAQNKNFLQIQMQRLLIKIQEVVSKSFLMLVMDIVIIVFVPFCIMEVFRQLVLRKDLREKEYLSSQARVSNVLANTLGLFAHPLVAIRGDLLSKMPGMTTHEDAQAQGLLTYFNSPESCAGKFILFISHQWLGQTSPDPEKIHFKTILNVVRAIADMNGLMVRDIYVWLDYSSIPQLNGVGIGTGANAIMSLISYAMISTAMCIVAPKAIHENGQVCDFATYMRRGWCRAEQAGYMLKNGTHNLYISDTQGLHMAKDDDDTLKTYDAFYTMDGDFTCCMRNHPKGMRCDKERLVDPMLYLYFSAKGMAGQAGNDFIYDLVMKNKRTIFPETFNKATESGGVRTPLFGDLLDHIEAMDANASDQERQSLRNPYVDRTASGRARRLSLTSTDVGDLEPEIVNDFV